MLKKIINKFPTLLGGTGGVSEIGKIPYFFCLFEPFPNQKSKKKTEDFFVKEYSDLRICWNSFIDIM